MNVVALGCLICTLSGPWIAREVFTSEQGLRVSNITPHFVYDSLTVQAYDRIKADVEGIKNGKDRAQILFSYIQDSLRKLGEVYTQRLSTVNWGRSSNIYSYLRSKDGFGNEAIVLAVPFDYNPSVVLALTFVELMAKRQPDWHSKDVLLLFYPESEYASGVREFLDAYYGVDGSGNPMGSLYGEEGRILGRPGYLR